MKDINLFVDELTSKFGYSEILSNDLKRIIPVMLEGKDEVKRQMLFDMLSETKIFVLQNMATVEDLEVCKKEVFGKDNKGITFIDADNGEYGKRELADGSYISEPIFDDDMNIVGRNRMLFVKELAKWDALREVYGTDINLSHLIHELGHAWVAEKDEYLQNEDGSFTQNVGAGTIVHSVDKGTKEIKGVKSEGIFIEETLNTFMEEQYILKLTGAKDMKELKTKGYIDSSYQGLMKSIMESYIEKFGIEAFEEYRFIKDKNVMENIEIALKETSAWSTLRTEEYAQAKRKNISTIDSLEISDEAKAKIKQFFYHYDNVYFPDNTKFTAMQKLDNVLEQIYNFGAVKYNFNVLNNDNNLEIYKKVVSAMVAEANALRNEARVVEKKDREVRQDMMSHLQNAVQDDKSVGEYYKSTTGGQNINNMEQDNKESR